MTFDPETRALKFGSEEELEQFHVELSSLLRTIMVASTKHIEDEHLAKDVSREVYRENHTLVRALNALRQSLARTAG